MEPISIVKGISSVIVAESTLFSWCKDIDSGIAILTLGMGVLAIIATFILWFLSKLDGDIKRVNSDLKSLSDKIDADSKSTNIRFEKQIHESNKRFDKIHGIILDIVRDKKRKKKKNEPKTDP